MKSVEIRDVNSTKSRVAMTSLFQKGNGVQISDFNNDACYFNRGLRIRKWYKFDIKECYPKRRPVSYITKYMLLMRIQGWGIRVKTMGYIAKI